MLKKFAAAALLLALAVPAFAQGPLGETPGLDKREAKMQRRIDQGKTSGALTDKEAARLEKREANLKRAEERAKAKHIFEQSHAEDISSTGEASV